MPEKQNREGDLRKRHRDRNKNIMFKEIAEMVGTGDGNYYWAFIVSQALFCTLDLYYLT